MMYLVDADVLIQAKKFYYGFDFCPAFWSWLDVAHGTSHACSVIRVFNEIKSAGDDLSRWAKNRSSFFLSPDNMVSKSLGVVSEYVDSCSYEDAAKAHFLSGADYYLVSHAHAHDFTVVTHEVGEPNRATKVKIPDVCKGLQVECIDPFAMLRRSGARFVLA